MIHELDDSSLHNNRLKDISEESSPNKGNVVQAFLLERRTQRLMNNICKPNDVKILTSKYNIREEDIKIYEEDIIHLNVRELQKLDKILNNNGYVNGILYIKNINKWRGAYIASSKTKAKWAGENKLSKINKLNDEI